MFSLRSSLRSCLFIFANDFLVSVAGIFCSLSVWMPFIYTVKNHGVVRLESNWKELLKARTFPSGLTILSIKQYLFGNVYRMSVIGIYF